MNNIGYIISGTGRITLVLNSKPHTIETDHKFYQEILKALKEKTYDKIESLVNIGKSITQYSQGFVKVIDGEIFYKNIAVNNKLTNRILNFMNDGLPFEPIINFFENVMQNPLVSAQNETYEFSEHNDLPLTEDGCFLAYKRVRNDFKDFYTGTYDNSVGKIVKMKRVDCDACRANTCSRGLHFCSFNYLREYHGGEGRVIIVKINPKNIISIPTDYNLSKGRCCEYFVIAEHIEHDKVHTLTDKVMTNDGKKVDVTTYHNVRDSKGRFVASNSKQAVKSFNRDAKGRFC
jgi:hypothetical protein